MCSETKQSLRCSCYTILYRICASHIARTHKQIDDAPCPDLHEEYTKGGRRCLPEGCEYRKDEFYAFESAGRGLFEAEHKEQDAWRKEREEREKRRERLKIGEFEERDSKKIKLEKDDCGENEITDTSFDISLLSDDSFDTSSAIESVGYSCPNRKCLNPDVLEGVCRNCGTITEEEEGFDETDSSNCGMLVDAASPDAVIGNLSHQSSCPTQKCLKPNVSDGYCRNCGTVIDRERFAVVVRYETCFNRDCREPNVVDGCCLACETSSACPHEDCYTPIVKHGVCMSCISIVDDVAYMADINARSRERGLIQRDGEVPYTKCPDCRKLEVLDGTCQSCHSKVPICVDDEGKRYDALSGTCTNLRSGSYDEHGVLSPGTLMEKNCVAHDVRVEGGVYQVCGILVPAIETGRNEEEDGDMYGVE